MNRTLYTFSVLSATMVAIGVTWVVTRTVPQPVSRTNAPVSFSSVTPTSTDRDSRPSDASASTWYDDTRVEVRGSANTYSWMKSGTGIRCVWRVDQIQILAGPAISESAAQKVRDEVQAMKDQVEEIELSNQEKLYVDICEERAEGIDDYQEDLSTEMDVTYNQSPYLAVVGKQTERISSASQNFTWVNTRLFDTRTGDVMSLEALISPSSTLDFWQRLAQAVVKDHEGHLFDPGEMSWYPTRTRDNIQLLQQFARGSKTQAVELLNNEEFRFFSQIPFALTGEGLVVYFDQESIAPHQQGVVTFVYPYADWADLLRPDVKAVLLSSYP